MSEWREYKIEELCTKVTSGGTPPTRNNEYYGGDIPWLKTQEVDFNRIYWTDVKITEEGLKNSSAKWIPENSVIMAMYGATAGRVAINKIPLTTNQACCNLIVNRTKANYKFIYYNLLSRFESIANMAVGGAQQNLNSKMIKELPIYAPDLATQTEIAEILSSLDDKIELNNRINKNLEELAQALFRQWFVEFEFPSENGEPYRSSGGPMVESELGLIPKGWRIDALENHADVSRGLSYKGSGLAEEGDGLPMHNLNSVFEGGGYKYEGIKFYNGDYKERHLVKPWDIIVTNTEQGHKYLLIGCAAFVPHYFGDKGLFSQHIYKLTSKPESVITNQFLYFLLRRPEVREQVIGCTNGTTVNMLSIDGLKVPRFVLPIGKLIADFTETAKGIWLEQEVVFKENKSLKQLRDTLLPRLMSGELVINELQEEATSVM